jgi:DNA-binding MarR family transcriptional regulator
MKPSVRSSKSSPSPEVGTPAGWTFLTNHTHVLLCLFRNPDERLRDVAVAVGITERMVQRIVSELAEAGYLQITKEGRRNHYRVNSRLRLRHPLESRHTIGELLTTLSPSE